ncbi:MAG TPA: VOC family protein [Candidatus Limnocylindria bacterium]|nr:VOC family protein [Candidatus Limnocylindria bacterium]
MSGPQIGPVFAFTAKHAVTAGFYTDIVGLQAGTADTDATWLKAGNAELVFHAPDDRETPAEVRAQQGFVVWFGVDDITAAFDKARAAKAVVGDFFGDYFFARDPDGRFIGIHVNEEHAHGHDHEH